MLGKDMRGEILQLNWIIQINLQFLLRQQAVLFIQHAKECQYLKPVFAWFIN